MKNNKYGLTVTSIQKYGFEKALAIWEKYDRKCSICGSADKLAVHHIDHSGLTDNPNNELDNLQLICGSCHAKLHANKRWERQLKEQGGYLYKGREKEWRDEFEKTEHRIQYCKEYTRKYYEENKEKLKKQFKEYRKTYVYSEEQKKRRAIYNKEYLKKYNAEHKEKAAEYHKKYFQENKDKWKRD
jgi:5-methylcytosine-specific restriction endonuclease McrA